jgi:hypothetical protein
MKKLILQKIVLQKQNRQHVFVQELNFKSLLIFFFHRTEFRAFFSSAELFGTEFREFSVPRNGLERNSESLLLFLFHGTEFRAFFTSAEQFGMEFREFSVPRNNRNSVGTNQLSVYSDFRRIIFLSEIANPSYEELDILSG